MAKEIFSILAQAEGEIHGQPADQVALQEVGAVDSIVDVAAAAVCVDLLGVDEILVSPLYEGSGFTHCSHGRTPVPAPATMRILQTAGLPLQITGTQGELVTPTGAAIAAALARPASQSFVVRKVGVGAGQKDFAHPNILRAMLVETEDCFAREMKSACFGAPLTTARRGYWDTAKGFSWIPEHWTSSFPPFI